MHVVKTSCDETEYPKLKQYADEKGYYIVFGCGGGDDNLLYVLK